MKDKTESKCTEKPARKGPMTVPVQSYKRKDGSTVKKHKRHSPK